MNRTFWTPLALLLFTAFAYTQDSAMMAAQYQAYLDMQDSSVVSVPVNSNPWSITSEFTTEWMNPPGDSFDVRLHIHPQPSGNAWSVGGLYFSARGIEDQSTFASVSVKPRTGVTFESNVNPSGNPVINSSSTISLPVWIRMEKSADSLRTHYRHTGAAPWTLLGSVPMSETLNPSIAKMKFKPK